MDKQRFAEILREYDYPEDAIEALWITRPNDDLNEDDIRQRAISAAPTMKILKELFDA